MMFCCLASLCCWQPCREIDKCDSLCVIMKQKTAVEHSFLVGVDLGVERKQISPTNIYCSVFNMCLCIYKLIFLICFCCCNPLLFCKKKLLHVQKHIYSTSNCGQPFVTNSQILISISQILTDNLDEYEYLTKVNFK